MGTYNRSNIHKEYIFKLKFHEEKNNINVSSKIIICPLFFSPHCCVLANISGTDIYRNRKDYVNVSHLLLNIPCKNIPHPTIAFKAIKLKSGMAYFSLTGVSIFYGFANKNIRNRQTVMVFMS